MKYKDEHENVLVSAGYLDKVPVKCHLNCLCILVYMSSTSQLLIKHSKLSDLHLGSTGSLPNNEAISVDQQLRQPYLVSR